MQPAGLDQHVTISIHAPHEGERPFAAQARHPLPCHFNPRSPRGGATKNFHSAHSFFVTFQSTLPTRGSDTMSFLALSCKGIFQSTLPTRGSDPVPFIHDGRRVKFQSTLPTRGSDRMHTHPLRHGEGISIHAPHEGERPRLVARVAPA